MKPPMPLLRLSPLILGASLLLKGLFTTVCADPAKVRLFILAGQSNMVGLDPESTFTPTVKAAFAGDEVIVIKDAQGGQPIRRWVKDWQSATGDKPDNSGDLYARLLVKVHEGIQGRKPDSVCFVWMQGERDAREQHGAVYAESLNRLIHQLMEDLQHPAVLFVLGRLSDFDLPNQRYPHWTRIREAQMRVAEASPSGRWIDTDDLNGPNDDLHYDADGYRRLGKRFAEAAIQLLQTP